MTAERYRKVPNVIEAIQFVDLASGQEIVDWIGDAYVINLILLDDNETAKLEIETLEGVMTADLNDYVIKGIEGEFYPCKPQIFEDSYLPAGPELVKKEMTIEWPRLVDGDPVTADMLKKAWGEFMVPIQEAGRGNETNVKVLLTIFRNVYGGMQN